MRKLSLRPEDLRVDSFHVNDGGTAVRGTVHGRVDGGTVGYGCTDLTVQASCVDTNCCSEPELSCFATCDCPLTVAGTCQQDCTAGREVCK